MYLCTWTYYTWLLCLVPYPPPLPPPPPPPPIPHNISLQVFQGLLRAHKDYHDTKNAMSRLWVHECFRVFCDRLVGEKDQETFVSLVSDKLGSIFDLTYHNLCHNKIPPIFGEKYTCTCMYTYMNNHVHRAPQSMEERSRKGNEQRKTTSTQQQFLKI